MTPLRKAFSAVRPISAAVHESTFSVSRSTAQGWLLPQLAALSRLMSSLPPHVELTMPSLSPTMNQGNIAEWKVEEGQEIAAGDVIAEVETDKATMDWESQDDGYVAKLLVPAGTKDIAVGKVVGILVEDKGDASAFADYKPSSSGSAEKLADSASSSSSADSSAASESSDQQRPRHNEVSSTMGPAARILLQGSGLSPSDVTPTGPRGIITKGDVLAAIADGVQPAQKPAPEAAAAPEKASEPSAAEAQSQKEAAKSGRGPPEQQKGEARQGAAQEPPVPEQAPLRRPQVPDSNIRALLARQMLQKGEPVPARWLRDWVGIREHTSSQ